MSKNRSFLLLILFGLPVLYGASLFLLTYYTEGDQVHYRRFYDALSGASPADVMPLAVGHVSSVEPISAYLLWMGASLGIQKDIFISALNTLLLLGISLLMRKHQVPWYVYPLILSNFYIIVLMTSAERLKIAYLMLVYSALLSNNSRLSFALALASPLAHLQSFILLGGVLASKLGDHLKSIFFRLRIRRKTINSCVVVTLIVIFLFAVVWEGLLNKAIGYMSQVHGASELAQIFVLIGVAFFVVRERLRMGLMLVSMIVAISMLGGMRVNMIAFSLFGYLLMLERRLQHPLVLAVFVYLSVKSIFFIRNIHVYGDGFEGWLF